MYELYFWPTPNGFIIRISPNNRIPALVDNRPADGGGSCSIWPKSTASCFL